MGKAKEKDSYAWEKSIKKEINENNSKENNSKENDPGEILLKRKDTDLKGNKLIKTRSKELKGLNKESKDSKPLEIKYEEEFISEWERDQLFAALHASLFWVGQEVPYNVEIDGKNYRLHEAVWKLVNKEEITDEEKEKIEECIRVISEKEKADEDKLKEVPLTRKEAKDLFHETAGLLRTVMDLKEIESGEEKKKREDFMREFSRQRIADAKRWAKFLKETEK